MHLLAAQPGGFVDDEGIIDLKQTAADVVILSAADSSLAALGCALEQQPVNYSIRLANWLQLLKPAAYDLYEDKVLEQARVVVVSLLGGESYWPYGLERLQAWATKSCAEQPRTLIVVPGDRASDLELLAASTVAETEWRQVWAYLREGGVVNAQQLLSFIAAEYLQLDARWQAPSSLPLASLYMPNQQQPVSLNDWQKCWQNQQPIVALLFYSSHLQAANMQMFDQLIEVLQQEGLNPLPIALSSLKDKEALALTNFLLLEAGAELILNSTGFSLNTSANADLASQPNEFTSAFSLDIPILQLILASSTEEDWREQSQGLRSRDIAMQVALPEMDGRIITRAVSFKAESHRVEAAQITLVRYLLLEERAQFVAKLAIKYADLQRKNNQQKRIALILANYPTKDGRIGNGVGLDTAASAVNILNALHTAGYALAAAEDLPKTGNELIERLLQQLTNNPNTLNYLPCWQSLDLELYNSYFAAMPVACQQAVLERWGSPEQDIKYRDGRLMISGVRLGETFVGIQPARGFNVDLAANYHDPDLVPPHNYLAFYFWLRHCYQIDAIIHLGKHGNLEWLPGKGNALSDQCWPDVALGPIPHFYPFIVNDPGEGSQAKRRSQAVIIDHLMPPMTRAETYAELVQLENLVDEYYQALGLDAARENWLKEEIIKQIKSTHLAEELKAESQEDLLAELDAYLCEIKEAQIRHGLHILGKLAETDKLVDTLVALLRLPRGSESEQQGILHNLCFDLGFSDFDPLAADNSPWLSSKPELLAQISDSLWRTEADTRERLELLAAAWIKRFVLEQENLSVLAAYPASQKQMEYARQVIQPALEQSATLEIESLLKGLAGKFVEPGPSGAPTRGRLDTLPTGRNFYAVDNRAIPSPAAWALGQKSAEALINRHLQEQGDYPKQLGLSVWGTATMRTGGDDIAQAFALMGVKPVWAEHSNRVIDFEIISAMQLGRPRVDVTLRVSGFFRDAFPNVIKLYDAAVQALKDYQDPGQSNTIRQHIQQRQQELIASGVQADKAEQLASYRVFGSKPGAYGAGLQGLIDERCWQDKSDLAEAYLNWGGYAYSHKNIEGEAAPEAFKYQLSQLEAVLQNQDNREHDLLDSDDYYQFQGGMSNAVEQFSEQVPIIYHGDHSNPQAPKIRTLQEELNLVIRSRLLNPKWIEAMREHGYKGAFEMSASVDYLFAYDATTGLIADYQYQQVTEKLLLDKDNQEFLKANNPHALEEMAERLMEAIERDMWHETDEYKSKLQDVLLDLDESKEAGTL